MALNIDFLRRLAKVKAKVILVVDTVPPDVPVNFVVTVASDTQINLSWDPVVDPNGITRYRVYRNSVLIFDTDLVSFEDKFLVPGTEYTYGVSAYDLYVNESEQIMHTAVTTSTDVTAPSVPVVTATAVSTTQINLSWPASFDAVGVANYKIYQGAALIDTVAGTVLSKNVTGLTANTQYSFQVEALDAVPNTSAKSTAAVATTFQTVDTIAPSIPANVQAAAISTTQIDVSWNASTDDFGVTAYKVWRDDVLIATLGNVLTYSNTGLTPATSYVFKVSALDAALNESAKSTGATRATFGAGTLSGSVVTGGSGNVNLTTPVFTDWAHWGLTDATTFNSKNGATQQISNITAIGAGVPVRYNNSPVNFTWTDGTPDAAATATPTGIYIVDVGKGFRITVPAGQNSNTVHVYATAFNSKMQIKATLSDGSAAPFIDESVTSTGVLTAKYTLTYTAASANQTLTIELTNILANAANTNIAIQAIDFKTTETVPTNFPIITNISAQTITDTSAQLSWTTDTVTQGYWQAGLTTAYNLTNSPGETSFNYSSHVQSITGLTPDTLYHYRVRATNQLSNESISSDNTFRTLPANTQPTTGFIWGIDGHFWDLYTTMTAVETANMIKSLGITYYRLDVNASQYAFVDALLDNGIKIVAILGGVYNDYNASFNEAVTFATRYLGRIFHYQLSNERDIASGTVQGDGRLTTDYDTAGYNAVKAQIDGLGDGIKSVDPTAKTIVNFAWLHYGFIQRLINDGIGFDITGIDWYWSDITNVNGLYNVPQICKDMGKEVWLTETNLKNGSLDQGEQGEADYITSTATAMFNNPNISGYFVYELLDEPANGNPVERFYGLMVNKTTPKLAFNAYKAAIAGTPASGIHAPPPTNPTIINVKNVGAIGNGVANDTAAIQAAVNSCPSGATVFVPAGTYMIDAVTSVKLKSNMTLRLDPAAILRAIPNAAAGYNVVLIQAVTNVNVIGGTIHGERDEHKLPGNHDNLDPNTNGEWGYCIGVIGSSNVFLEGIILKKGWGDGVQFGESATPCINCTVVGCTMDNNRRQGMSVTKANGMLIRDNVFKFTEGAWPNAGVDLEPSRAGDIVENIEFYNNQFIDCVKSAGLKIYVGPGIVRNITADGNVMSRNVWGCYFNGACTNVKILNNTIQNNIQYGIWLANGAAAGTTRTNNTLTGNPIAEKIN